MKALLEKMEDLLEIGGTKKDITLLAISALSLVFSLAGFDALPFDAAWISTVLCGLPIILKAIAGLILRFDIKADVLVSMALIASVCIGEDFAAGEVAFIMQLGGLLEDLTASKSREGIEKLVSLTPRTARVIVDGAESVIPAEEVEVGALIRVLPGETVPVDGVIISGQTSVNQAVMTGESLPVDKGIGDEVSSGTVNQFGAFELRATRVGEDSSIQRMIRLVQSADAGKAKIVGIADRWATWIVVIALTAAALTWIFSGEIIRSVTILVVFCPCALVLATPTAIMAAIGNATSYGFLVKEGDALERLAAVKKIAFDKTGTLTYGVLKVEEVFSANKSLSDKELFSLAASCELNSEHPLGKAIVKSFKEKYGSQISQPEGFEMIPGRGVSALIDGGRIIAGNKKMLDEYSVDTKAVEAVAQKYIDLGCTLTYIAAENELSGFIALSDAVREESGQMIASIKELGVKPILLTGDNENAAKAKAKSLDINEVKANCLPEDKLEYIASLQKNNDLICMVGDGINDAPALKKSHVGIAMGGVGSDIAIDAADIAIVDDEIKNLPHLLALSKRMMRTIKLNLTFSMTLNFVSIILAIIGTLNPVIGALVHNAGSVTVVINSALLLKWRNKNDH